MLPVLPVVLLILVGGGTARRLWPYQLSNLYRILSTYLWIAAWFVVPTDAVLPEPVALSISNRKNNNAKQE